MRLAPLLLMLGSCSSPPAPPFLLPPGPPTEIEARIIERRGTTMEVCWRAPVTKPGHQEAISFELRYARRPVTEGNFDDPAVTARVPVPWRGPFADGQRICQIVDHLYIENDYWFGVAAVGDRAYTPAIGGPNT